ncbi:MAG: nucleotidyltransferase domain-containing protein [Chloroflexi bacterium]|nr:nucleotidyltransferase domain-containing protein [Chloroflexota bacterium]
MRKSNRFVAELQTKGFQIQYAYLYGSYAKGYARPDSDIDIAIVSNDLSGDWLDDYCHLTRIADGIDARMEVISLLPQDFHEKNPLVWEIKSFGVPLTGNGKRRAIKRKPIQRTERK